MSTSLTGLTTNFFPSAQNGFSTTLASTISSGATTVPLNSVAGYSNGQIAVMVVDPTDTTKKQTFTGIVDTAGVQLTSVVWTAGVNQSHSGGSTVVDYATATHVSMITKGLTTTVFDQDGTLKTGAVDVAAVLSDSVVTTAKLNADAVTAAKLADDSVFPANLTSGQSGSTWAWQTYVPTYGGGGITVGNGIVVAKWILIGKTVHFKYKLTFGSTTSISSSPTITLPIASTNDYDISTGQIGNSQLLDSSATTAYPAFPLWGSATTFKLIGLDISNVRYEITATAPFTWATGDILFVTGMYEAS